MGLSSGWRQLRACRHAQCAYRCPASASYASHLQRLPSLSLAELQLPPRTHVLLYGPSFLGELADAIVCASEAEGGLLATDAYDFPAQASPPPPAHAPPPPPPGARTLQSSYECCGGGVGEQARGGTLVTHTFARNASLTLVINYAPLQRTDSARRHLAAFVRSRRGSTAGGEAGGAGHAAAHAFTHVVYMQPHPDCFFERQTDSRRPPCVNLAAAEHSAADVLRSLGTGHAGGREATREAAAPLHWRILTGAHSGPAFYAFAWKAWRAEAQRALWNLTSPVGAHRTLTPAPIIAAPCLMGGCDGRVPEGLAGHQCLPGASTLISREIVRAVRRTRASNGRAGERAGATREANGPW